MRNPFVTALYGGKWTDGVQCDSFAHNSVIGSDFHMFKSDDIRPRTRPAVHDTSNFTFLLGMPVCYNGGTQTSLKAAFIRSYDASLDKPFCIVEDQSDLMPSSTAKCIFATVDELDYRMAFVTGFNNSVHLDSIPKFLHKYGCKMIQVFADVWVVPYNTRNSTAAYIFSPRFWFCKVLSITHVVLEQKLSVLGLAEFTRKLTLRNFSETKLLTMDYDKLYDLGAQVGMSHQQRCAFAMSRRLDDSDSEDDEPLSKRLCSKQFSSSSDQPKSATPTTNDPPPDASVPALSPKDDVEDEDVEDEDDYTLFDLNDSDDD